MKMSFFPEYGFFITIPIIIVVIDYIVIVFIAIFIVILIDIVIVIVIIIVIVIDIIIFIVIVIDIIIVILLCRCRSRTVLFNHNLPSRRSSTLFDHKISAPSSSVPILLTCNYVPSSFSLLSSPCFKKWHQNVSNNFYDSTS